MLAAGSVGVVLGLLQAMSYIRLGFVRLRIYGLLIGLSPFWLEMLIDCIHWSYGELQWLG